MEGPFHADLSTVNIAQQICDLYRTESIKSVPIFSISKKDPLHLSSNPIFNQLDEMNKDDVKYDTSFNNKNHETNYSSDDQIPNKSKKLSLHEKSGGNKILKLISLNVAGLSSKLNKGILDQFLAEHDIICLSETNTDSPDFSNTMLNEYICIAKSKINPYKKHKYGGIHGICVLVRPCIADKIEIIPDMISECVLWIRIQLQDRLSFILGATYVPCETSRFLMDGTFADIEADLLDLKSKYNEPLCLMGDFNAHTQNMSDIPVIDDLLALETGCDWLAESKCLNGLQVNKHTTSHRYSKDVAPMNRNGKELIQMCKSFDMCIMNGRIGRDKYIGLPTCRKGSDSVVDYVIANDVMIQYACDFQVELFDQCMSDVHCPILFHLSVPLNEYSNIKETLNQAEPEQTGKDCPNRYLSWSPEIAAAFVTNLSNSKIEILENNLELLSCQATQTCPFLFSYKPLILLLLL